MANILRSCPDRKSEPEEEEATCFKFALHLSDYFKVGRAPRANTERYLRQLTAAVSVASQIYNFGRIVSIFIDGWLWLELKSLAENGHIFLLNGPVDEEKESLFTRMAIASMSDKGPP